MILPSTKRWFAASAAFALVGFLFTGCASSVPTARYTQPIGSAARVGSTDKVTVTVAADDALKMIDTEKTRLRERIAERIGARKAETASTAGRDLLVEVTVTRYDKGNAFARAMLAGLGQIHIDGSVQLLTLPGRTAIGAFDIKKTFAWGGIYGGTTNIETIEQTFAEGVAAAVTGTEEEKKK